MKLVDNWRAAPKWFSTQATALNLAFLGAWGLLPEKFQDAIPASWMIGIAIVLLALGFFGRLVDQGTGSGE